MLARSDHPRVCGKNDGADQDFKAGMGSPPRVREKRFNCFRCLWEYGITPACAGKTINNKMINFKLRDHPRVCGKNQKTANILSQLMGSPPRVREKLHFCLNNSRPFRITPACAGKTADTLVSRSLDRDHPRVCGKNLNVGRNVKPELGSPPRVREKPYVNTFG